VALSLPTDALDLKTALYARTVEPPQQLTMPRFFASL
jgi:hypothetical protein